MPYKLRKAPKRELYWVVTTETGKKHSKDPIPLEKAKAQMRILESALTGGALKNTFAGHNLFPLLKRATNLNAVTEVYDRMLSMQPGLRDELNKYTAKVSPYGTFLEAIKAGKGTMVGVIDAILEYVPDELKLEDIGSFKKGGMLPVGPPMGIIPGGGPMQFWQPGMHLGPRRRGPGVRGGPNESTSSHPKSGAKTSTGGMEPIQLPDFLQRPPRGAIPRVRAPAIYFGRRGPNTSTSSHPEANPGLGFVTSTDGPKSSTGRGKCCCGKGKYSKVAIDVMESALGKKEDALFQWIKQQTKSGVNMERLVEEMKKGGVPDALQFDLIRQALQELAAEKRRG